MNCTDVLGVDGADGKRRDGSERERSRLSGIRAACLASSEEGGWEALLLSREAGRAAGRGLGPGKGWRETETIMKQPASGHLSLSQRSAIVLG